jgi:hypothetical protein
MKPLIKHFFSSLMFCFCQQKQENIIAEYTRDATFEEKVFRKTRWQEQVLLYGGIGGFPLMILMALIFREFGHFFVFGYFAFFVIAFFLDFFRLTPKCPHCGKRTKEIVVKHSILPVRTSSIQPVLYICKRCKIYANSGIDAHLYD